MAWVHEVGQERQKMEAQASTLFKKNSLDCFGAHMTWVKSHFFFFERVSVQKANIARIASVGVSNALLFWLILR